MTHPKSAELAGAYEILLREYLVQVEESSLEQAYEIGKKAVASGLGLLEICQLHVEVVDRVMLDLAPLTANKTEVYRRAQTVFNECLVPFEAAYRGFQEANLELKKAHQKQEFLARATIQLSAHLDQKNVIKKILSLATEQLATGAFIEISSPGSDLEHRIFGSSDRSAVDAHDPKSNLCILNPNLIEVEAKVQDALWTEHFETAPPKNLSWKVVHLRGNLKYLGSLLLVQSPEQAEESSVLPEFIFRVTTALENAALYRESQLATRSREDILSVVSHDLRNPLSGVALNAEMMLRVLRDQPPDSPLRISAERIKKGLKTMNILIEDILDLARINSGKLALTIHPLAYKVGALVSDTVAMMGPMAQERQLELKTEILCEAEDVYCDPARILQVFSNLIGNSIKFTPKGGTITIRAKLLGESILFSVWDTGQGISAEKLPKVFDRLWQSGSTSAGIGLGLYIARAIVQAHGGEICPDSTPSQGSTFFFTLPRRAIQINALGRPWEQAG